MRRKSNRDLLVVVGRRVRDRRSALGMTMAQLGAACGVSYQQIAKYELGNNNIAVHILARMAVALQVDLEWLVHGGDQPSAPVPERHVREVMDGYVRLNPRYQRVIRDTVRALLEPPATVAE